MDDSDPRALERIGTVLHEKWTLERILGSGGMGAVYAARHRNGARGAVKILHPELARRSDVRERFLREGYAANRVEHRGAVQVLDDDIVKEGPDEGLAYLVMEMLEGESLEERIERGPPLTELELLAILNDVLAVLEAAHEHGVIHRDLKPANIFLNADPAGPGVKVLDFGLARIEEARSVTGVGLALGTPSFMAPEQANGRTSEIDARSDLFAIGATAFSILAGRDLHEADGVLELVARMGTLPAPKLREVAPQVSEPMARVVDRACQFEREARYPSAAAMRADVQAAIEALTPAADAPPVPAPASAAPQRASRAPLVLAVLIAAGLALLLFVPNARERASGSALGEMLGSKTDTPDARAAPESEGGSDANPAAAPIAAGVDVDAALDAASAAELDAAAADGGDDDDDDDDDVDASDIAAIAGGHEGGASAGPRPPAVKRPRVAPGRLKHGRPPKRRHKRPKR